MGTIKCNGCTVNLLRNFYCFSMSIGKQIKFVLSLWSLLCIVGAVHNTDISGKDGRDRTGNIVLCSLLAIIPIWVLKHDED